MSEDNMMVASTSLEIETARFARVDRYSPNWMERATPGRLRAEAEQAVDSLRREMREQQAAPVGGHVTVVWRLDVEAVAGRYPADEAVQQALPFEEFEAMMQRVPPHQDPPRMSFQGDLADLAKAYDRLTRLSGGG